MAIRLAVLGDAHLHQPTAAPWRLLGKRLLAEANARWSRRRRFETALWDPVVEAAARVGPDLVLFAGDLTTTARRAEMERGAEPLQRLAAEVPVVAVPGNHDRYTRGATRRRLFEQVLGPMVPARFPLLRDLGGGWTLLALDSAQPRCFDSRGRVGAAQREAARRAVEALPADERLLVLCHYPVDVPEDASHPASHQLTDRAELGDLLAVCPAITLFVHGHVHEPWCRFLAPERRRHGLDLCAGAPTLKSLERPTGQGFWELLLHETGQDGPPAEIWHHQPRPSGDGLAWGRQAVQPWPAAGLA